jgi:hypothetical protein
MKQLHLIKTEIEWNPMAFAEMLRITLRVNEHFNIWNALAKLETDPELEKYLVEQNVGFAKENVRNLWFYGLLSTFLEATEFLRNFLSLVLRPIGPFKGKKPITLGMLTKALAEQCKMFGPDFANEVDVELRNAVAHGLYWLATYQQDGSIRLHYCEKLGDAPKTRPLQDTVIAMQRHGLLGSCFAEVLSKKGNAGYFI